ncbi:MAG TPA: hypothetical protein VIU40_04225 [Geobacteraceae bacterium]
MQIVISIDDTDNLESRGTGALASLLAAGVEAKGWGKSRYITRHQLLVHPGIPYTSHNSAMCFTAEVGEVHLESIIDYAAGFLARESATGSDPGLCVVAVDRLASLEPLIAFSRKAKQAVVTMEEAFTLARQEGIHLSEHGGTGQGVIGALAGAGLRLSGNDGRLKGWLEIAATDGRTTVAEFRAHPDVDEVRSLDGRVPAGAELVRLGDKVKTVLLDGKSVLLVEPLDDAGDGVAWQTCSKQRLRSY